MNLERHMGKGDTGNCKVFVIITTWIYLMSFSAAKPLLLLHIACYL